MDLLIKHKPIVASLAKEVQRAFKVDRANENDCKVCLAWRYHNIVIGGISHRLHLVRLVEQRGLLWKRC